MSYNKLIINGETKIDLTADTVAADKMLADTTAHDKAGEQVTGTIPVDQEPEVSGTTTTYKAGYYSTPIVVEEGTTGEGDPIISGSVEDKTLVLNKQSGTEINVDLSPLDNSYIKKSGDTVTGALNVAKPTEDANAATKKYVDESVKSVYPTEIVTGNPVVCENGAEYGLQGLKVYGKSTQDGTPSPENPIPIVSAGDDGSIALTVSNGASLSQSMTIATPNGLPGIPVDSGGNYTDADGQIFFSSFRDYASKTDVVRVKSFHVDTSPDSRWHSRNTGEYVDLYTYNKPNDYQVGYKNIICELLPYKYAVYGGVNLGCCLNDSLTTDTNAYLLFSFDRQTFNALKEDSQEVIVQKFKDYIGPDGFSIFYICTSIETPIPPEELAAYRALHTYDGTTTISTSEDVSGIEVQYLKKNRALPTSTKQDAGRVVTVNDQGQFSLTDKYLDGVDLDSIFSLFIDGKNTTEMFWKWYPLTDKYGSTKYTRLERWCKLLANAWSNKTYTLRFYKASVSGDYTGTPLDDLADGREAAPLVTDSSEPTEDWAENDPMTWYIRANALSLADGTMDILYFEGEDGFDITGEIAPVYSFALNLYLKHWTDESYKYTSWKTVKADGYKSMAEGIAPDNSYRAVTWHPSFDGGLNAAGGLTSGANKKPVIWTSAQDALPLARKITPYEGLWTDCDQQYILSQWQLRHWTLENSNVLNGCQNYNYQYTLAVAESDVKRLIVTTEQGANFIVGSNVCLGEKGVNESTNRNQAYTHDILNCATITSIENVNISEAEYTALNLGIEEPIATTTTMLVSTIPWSSGTTEALQGHSDGCIGNLTNGKYPIRVAGIEIMNGTNVIELEPLWQASIVEDHWKYEVYSCRDSEKQAGGITEDYEKTGEFTLPNAKEWVWHYIKDMNELESEAMIPLEFGGSSSTYYCSALYSPGRPGGAVAPWRGGYLEAQAAGGLSSVYSSTWLTDWGWHGAPRLTGAGKKRGEPAP